MGIFDAIAQGFKELTDAKARAMASYRRTILAGDSKAVELGSKLGFSLEQIEVDAKAAERIRGLREQLSKMPSIELLQAARKAAEVKVFANDPHAARSRAYAALHSVPGHAIGVARCKADALVAGVEIEWNEATAEVRTVNAKFAQRQKLEREINETLSANPNLKD